MTDFQTLMGKIDERANHPELIVQPLTAAATTTVYMASKDIVAIPEKSDKGQKRTLAWMTWTSVLRVWRVQQQKLNQVQAPEN